MSLSNPPVTVLLGAVVVAVVARRRIVPSGTA